MSSWKNWPVVRWFTGGDKPAEPPPPAPPVQGPGMMTQVFGTAGLLPAATPPPAPSPKADYEPPAIVSPSSAPAPLVVKAYAHFAVTIGDLNLWGTPKRGEKSLKKFEKGENIGVHKLENEPTEQGLTHVEVENVGEGWLNMGFLAVPVPLVVKAYAHFAVTISDLNLWETPFRGESSLKKFEKGVVIGVHKIENEPTAQGLTHVEVENVGEGWLNLAYLGELPWYAELPQPQAPAA